MQLTKAGSPSLHSEPSKSVAATRPAGVSRQSSNQLVGQVAGGSGSQADMEVESEGALVGAMQALELDSKVRAAANLGFEQIRSIEQQLRSAPQGFLGRPDLSDARDLRTTIFSSSVTIVGSFTKIIGLLSAPNTTSGRNDNLSTATSHTYDSTPPHSPLPHGSAPAGTSKEPTTMNAASPVISPVTTPHSGSGMSGDSPNPNSPGPLDSDGDAVAAAAATTSVAGGAGRPRRPSNEAATSADPDVARPRNGVSVRRRFLPKHTVRQPASGTDPGNDAPPDDGHTWRKYGQKDILGSRHPRGYYKCTHKNELGCPAIKYVQRCDEDPSFFDVTYKGNHNCQSIQQQYSAWPFSYSPEQLRVMTRTHQLSPPDSSAIGNYPTSLGGSHLSPPSTTGQASHEILFSRSSIRHNFSELAGGRAGGLSVGGASTSAISDHVPSAGTSRFGLNPNPSIELPGVYHPQDFQAEPEDSNPSQQAVFDVSRLRRSDTLFDTSTLFQMLMASTRTPAQNDLSSALMDEDPPSHGDVKRPRLQHGPLIDQMRSTLSEATGRQLGTSTQVQYEQRWGAELGAELESEVFHLQLDEQVPVSQSYGSSSPVMLDNSRELLSKQTTTSTEGGRITTTKESATPERTPASLSMGFDLDEMDNFDGPSFHSSSSGFFC